MDQASLWLTRAGLKLSDDEEEWLDGYGYRQLLLRASIR
jgi:hypothetical protein